jgi:hypothetical protein
VDDQAPHQPRVIWHAMATVRPHLLLCLLDPCLLTQYES